MMVSVIIPNYNHERYLKLRIDSVLNQTYQDFEIILLDDKSTDNSISVLEEYKNHPKVSHCVFNDTNSGTTFRQWQKGINLAKGDLIWIAESDDYAEPTFLEKSIKYIEKYNAVLSCACSEIVNENGHKLRSRAPILDSVYCDKTQFVRQYLLTGNVVYNASTVVFRKDAIDDSIWDQVVTYKYCGDWFFWAKLIMNNTRGICEIKEYLNHFRTHTGNVSNKSETNGLTFLEGFPISQMIARDEHIKYGKEYTDKWFFEWQHYRAFYNFSKETNLKIFLMFLRKEPTLAISEVKRLIKRLFQSKK